MNKIYHNYLIVFRNGQTIDLRQPSVTQAYLSASMGAYSRAWDPVIESITETHRETGLVVTYNNFNLSWDIADATIPL